MYNEIEEDDELRIQIDNLRKCTFFDSHETDLTEYQVNVIIKDNVSFENIIANVDKFQFIKGLYVIRELSIENVKNENINKLITKLHEFNIETLVLLDVENIVFPEGY